MNLIFFIVMTLSCHKPLTHIGAKNYFADAGCARTLKYHMKMVGCKDIQVEQESEHQWLVRCFKPDKLRGEFWDNYIFRISPSVALYNPEDLPIVEKHTICIDQDIRIEAYAPE